MAGSTVLGSFDDFTKVSEICKKHGVWNHIDGCWGGFLAFSEKNRHMFKGAELSDSITMNCHKGQPLP